MEISLLRLPEPVSFRFFADFSIQIRANEIAEFTVQQHSLLQAIVASPATLRRVSRMALETDLAGVTGRHLSDLFVGPNNEEILDLFLMCLPEKEVPYWKGLRDGPGDSLHQELMPVFLAFDVGMRRAGVEELNGVTEPWKKTVGPTIDVRDLRER